MLFDFFKTKKKIPSPWKKFYTDNEINIDIPNISLYDQINSSSKLYKDKLAYVYLGKKVKYNKFIRKIDNSAIAFRNLGIKKGDVVTICLPNVPEALISLYALNKIGAICNMLHPLSAEQEIKDSLIKTNSNYLIMIDMFYDKIKNTIDSTMVKKVIFVSVSNSMKILMKLPYTLVKIIKYEHYPRTKKFISWNVFKLYSFYNRLKEFPTNGKNTPAVILNSGGTSGKPKHVVLQNRAFILSAMQEKMVLKNLNVGDSCLGIMPNFHGFGLSVTMHTPLSIGCYTILVPQFDPKKFDTLIKHTKPTIILGVPTLYEALINSTNEKDLNLAKVKYIICGGDKLSKNLEERVNKYLLEHNCKSRIVQGYGLSEALAAVSLAHDEINKEGSIGIPLPGNYIKIINPSTRERMPFDEVGEICIHTKALMMGYLNNENETNQALQIHDDGHIWLHTGDLGKMDKDGFIFYEGRIKRMIISSGYNVYPAYVEEVIETHPAVLQCSVVAMPHNYKKEVPKAYIVLKEGFHGLFIKEELKEYCKKNLEHHMIPYKFVIRKGLPKTKLGKVDFKKLQNDNDIDEI
ncbi:MAG: AMP-binding protein [Bacilli bacterium]|nr:AMP-binding protein [Bacilli bacterium]